MKIQERLIIQDYNEMYCHIWVSLSTAFFLNSPSKLNPGVVEYNMKVRFATGREMVYEETGGDREPNLGWREREPNLGSREGEGEREKGREGEQQFGKCFSTPCHLSSQTQQLCQPDVRQCACPKKDKRSNHSRMP